MDQKKALHEWKPIKAGAEVYVVRGTQVLMFRRADDAPMFPGFWVGPGGHVDEDEDFLAAAVREAYEETGVKVDTRNIKLKAIGVHRRTYRNEVWVLPIFLTRIGVETELTINREGKAAWVEIAELLKMDNVLPSAKYYFEHVLNDKPGVLYTNLVWNEKGLVEEASRSVDRDY